MSKELPEEFFDDDNDTPHHGKKPAQKLKPYVVLQYLLKNTDENHLVDADDIVDYLKEDCRIFAERRSVYKDIEEINIVALMLRDEITVDEAREQLEADKDDNEIRLVVYDKKRKGYYANSEARQFTLDDMRLLAECVYSAKFIAEAQAKNLINVVCDFVSDHQAEEIRHNVFLTDRVKTNNRAVLYSLSTINKAMSMKLDGKSHAPEKIRFKYLKNSIDEVGQQIERKKGETYTVSPFKLIINDGNYYLLAYNEKSKAIWTYRVDRMKDVKLTGEPREGEEEFRKIDLYSFAQRTFSMYSGRKEDITIRFRMSLLDTAIEQFGTKNVRYKKTDEHHFNLTATVDVSNQFFAWLTRFDTGVKLLSPQSVVDEFSAYLGKIQKMYSKPAGK
jgi:hypothetical protein